jgi:hypothetical protein
MEIVQLVPDLDPQGGVASYARALAGALAAHGVSSRLVHPPSSSPRAAPARHGANIDALGLGHSTLLLHYSNYGYAPRGCPRGLVAGLERWRANGGPRLVTVFHELYATGRPWQSSFWLSPLQRQLAARMCRTSDGAVTSLSRYAARLRSWSPGATIAALPVFSTVGETPDPLPPVERRPALVVLGSPGLRRRAYATVESELRAACAALAVTEIVDVGSGHVAPAAVGSVPVRRMGFLDTAEVAALLATCRAGFVCYPAEFLGKSTVFAAYCAHGMVPIAAWPGEREMAHDFPCWQPASSAAPDWAAQAAQAHGWYQGHDLATHTQTYLSLLQ